MAFDGKILNECAVQSKLTLLTNAVLVRKAAADTPFDDAPVEKGALTLKNLTWEVSEEEIAEFFEGYHYIRKSLKWQVNKKGK
jgi:RNA recognition motif-containing protein